MVACLPWIPYRRLEENLGISFFPVPNIPKPYVRPSTEGPLPIPASPKVPRGSANSLQNSRWRTPIHVLGLTVHSLSITPGLPNRTAIEGTAAVFLCPRGTGLPNDMAAPSRLRRIPSPTNDCRTSGHRSTTEPTSNSHSITMKPTRDACLDMYMCQALPSDRFRLFIGRVAPLCPSSIRNTRKRQGYRWISTHFLLVGRSMDYRTRATISWAATSTHSWVACSGLKPNSFLHITKKTAKSCGKPTTRLAHTLDRNHIKYPHLGPVSTLPSCND